MVNKSGFLVFVIFYIIGATANVAMAEVTAQIGYVDMNRVMFESNEGKRFRSDMEKFVNQKKRVLESEGKKIEEMKNKYEKDKLVLSDTQKEEMQKKYNAKVNEYKKMLSDAEREAQKKESERNQKVIPIMRQIISDLAKEKNLLFVFPKGEAPAVYAADGPDLTEEVLKQYNAKQR
jgi:outer membrane protein